jgi:hypothetical protein
VLLKQFVLPDDGLTHSPKRLEPLGKQTSAYIWFVNNLHMRNTKRPLFATLKILVIAMF